MNTEQSPGFLSRELVWGFILGSVFTGLVVCFSSAALSRSSCHKSKVEAHTHVQPDGTLYSHSHKNQGQHKHLVAPAAPTAHPVVEHTHDAKAHEHKHKHSAEGDEHSHDHAHDAKAHSHEHGDYKHGHDHKHAESDHDHSH